MSVPTAREAAVADILADDSFPLGNTGYRARLVRGVHGSQYNIGEAVHFVPLSRERWTARLALLAGGKHCPTPETFDDFDEYQSAFKAYQRDVMGPLRVSLDAAVEADEAAFLADLVVVYTDE